MNSQGPSLLRTTDLSWQVTSTPQRRRLCLARTRTFRPHRTQTVTTSSSHPSTGTGRGTTSWVPTILKVGSRSWPMCRPTPETPSSLATCTDRLISANFPFLRPSSTTHSSPKPTQREIGCGLRASKPFPTRPPIQASLRPWPSTWWATSSSPVSSRAKPTLVGPASTFQALKCSSQNSTA